MDSVVRLLPIIREKVATGILNATDPVVELRPDIAQRIVERVASSLDCCLSVTDPRGLVLASTDSSLVHTYISPTVSINFVQVAGESPDDVRQRAQFLLTYADQVIGALVLEGISRHDQQAANMAKTLAELIIHQMLVIEELPHQTRLRDKFVDDLLQGRLKDADSLVQQQAAWLGIDLDLPRVVAVIDIQVMTEQWLRQPLTQTSLPKFTRALWKEQNHTNLVDTATRTIANHPEDMYSFIGDHWLVLLAVADQPLETTHHRVALRVRSFLQGSGGDRRSAGVGPCYPGWCGLALSFTDAVFALEAGTRLHGFGGAYCREDLGLADFIGHPERAAKADRARLLLATINDDPDLLATLKAFLLANLSPSVTAEQLHIHRHTLAYRLNKIHHRTGLDPRHFVDAAQLHAALLLQAINDA